MFPFIQVHLEKTTWHELVAVVVCSTNHPFSVLVAVLMCVKSLDGFFKYERTEVENYQFRYTVCIMYKHLTMIHNHVISMNMIISCNIRKLLRKCYNLRM